VLPVLLLLVCAAIWGQLRVIHNVSLNCCGACDVTRTIKKSVPDVYATSPVGYLCGWNVAALPDVFWLVEHHHHYSSHCRSCSSPPDVGPAGNGILLIVFQDCFVACAQWFVTVKIYWVEYSRLGVRILFTWFAVYLLCTYLWQLVPLIGRKFTHAAPSHLKSHRWLLLSWFTLLNPSKGVIVAS